MARAINPLKIRPSGSALETMTFDDIQRSLEELHPASIGWTLSCCRWNQEEAEEVLQTTYLKVLDGRAHFGGRSSFRTWLFGVIRRTAADHRRRQWLRSVASLRWRDERPGSPPPSPETGLRQAESSQALRAALRTLPARLLTPSQQTRLSELRNAKE